MTIEQPPETQNLKSQITEYCAFDGEKYIGGQIDNHTVSGSPKQTYLTCDQEDSQCDITDSKTYATGDVNLKPYFEDGKLLRGPKAQDEAKN